MSDPSGLMLDGPDRTLLAALPDSARDANGVPTPDLARRRRSAVHVVREVVGDLIVDDGIRHSVLGPEWSSDLDLHVRSRPSPTELAAAGWLPLDGLLRRAGRNGRDRWAVRDRAGLALAMADFDLGPRPDPLEGTLERARRRGEVRVREVLELRKLQREGRALPANDGVVVAAARAEIALGGDELPPAGAPSPAVPPIALTGVMDRSPAARRRRPAWAKRRFVVAFSGVDGAGKSTVSGAVDAELRVLGIPVEHVWARPGVRVITLDRLARLARRMLRQSAEPAMQRVARGLPTASPSRRGALGWMWALLITASFLTDVWRQHLRTGGVVFYDRHALDAEVTLAFVYRGVDLRFHTWLVRRAMPRADATVYLDVSAEVAASRKPDDTFGAHAIAAQLDEYARRLPVRTAVRVLEPGPVAELAATVLEVVAAAAPAGS